MQKIAISVEEAVEISGIGRSKLYQLLKDGSISPRKVGKRTLIIVNELEEYLKGLSAR